MKEFKNRIYFRYVLIFSCLAICGYLAFHLLAGRMLLASAGRSVQKVWESLRSFDPAMIEDEADEAEDILDELEVQSHFIIFDEDLEVVFATTRQSYGRDLYKYIRDGKETFDRSPEPEQITEISRERIEIRGLTEFDGLYYVYVFKNMHTALQNLQFADRALLAGLAVVIAAAWILLYVVLQGAMKPLGAVIEEAEAIARGDYSVRKADVKNRDGLTALSNDLSSIAEKMYRQEATLDNYAFLSRKKESGSAWQGLSQKEIVSNMTHQLKTPLAIISSQVELSQDETDPVKREYYYQSVMEEIDKMSALITGILKGSGSENAYGDTQLRRICISDLLSELVPKYESWMQGKMIRFSASIEENLHVMADPDQIEQAVHNYMMNAGTHTRTGRCVSLTLSHSDGDCEISVYNDGDGIAAGEMEKIWDSGYQADLHSGRGDIGLGLYIVSLIVEAHNGTCGVKNEEKGVRFWIRLPLLRG